MYTNSKYPSHLSEQKAGCREADKEAKVDGLRRSYCIFPVLTCCNRPRLGRVPVPLRIVRGEPNHSKRLRATQETYISWGCSQFPRGSQAHRISQLHPHFLWGLLLLGILQIQRDSRPFESAMSTSDIEKEGGKPYYLAALDENPELPPQLQRIADKGFLGTLRHYEHLLDQKLGVEAHGPARILPEDRDPAYGRWNKQIVMALMWASGTMNLSCFTTGFLGSELGLDLSQTIWITIVASFVGSAVTVRESFMPL
jgi:hypothetical protein